MKTRSIPVVLIVAVPTMALAGTGHHEASFADWLMHSIPVVVAGVGVYLALKGAQRNPAREGALSMIALGVLAIGLIHIAELLFEVMGLFHVEDEAMEWLEHILAMVGLALIAIGLGHFKGSYEKKQNETQKISVRMDKERV